MPGGRRRPLSSPTRLQTPDFVDGIATRSAAVVIPSGKNRTTRRDIDTGRYKDQAERFGAKVPQHRRVATRCDETPRNFLARAHIVPIVILLR